MESAVAEGVIITMPSSFAAPVIALVHPEVTEPTTSPTPSDTRELKAFRHSVGSDWSSVVMSSICLPSMPPASLISFTARVAPLVAALPKEAYDPVLGAMVPILIVSPEEVLSAASAVSSDASEDAEEEEDVVEPQAAIDNAVTPASNALKILFFIIVSSI